MSKIEDTLMDNLFDFYLVKYEDSSISEIEKHFLIGLGALVDRGEISKASVKKYLLEKGIEGRLPTNSISSSSSSSVSSGYGDGCGSSRSYRSSC